MGFFSWYAILLLNLVKHLILQIMADGKAKPKFVSLCASILAKESVVNDLYYLHSPESKFLLRKTNNI